MTSNVAPTAEMPSGLYHIKLWEAIDGSRNIVYTYTDGEIDGSNMRKEKIIVRPHGALYTIVQTVILSVYISLIAAIIYLLITGLEIKDIFRTLLFIGGGIIAVYLTVFEIIKIVRYKIIVSNKATVNKILINIIKSSSFLKN